MTTTNEALKLVRLKLHALQQCHPHAVLTLALEAEELLEKALAQPEPLTEWLVCPKCNHQSPYSPIKAKTLEREAERITKQARAVLAQRKPLTDEQAHQTLLDMGKHMETFGDESTTEQQLSSECIRFILERVAAHNIKEAA